MEEAELQGWCTDPYELHDARYFSAGRPTKLVRDSGEESYDPPPDGAPIGRSELIEEMDEGDASDLQRADTGRDTSLDMSEAAENSITAWMGPT
jgi:hypothetical protein